MWIITIDGSPVAGTIAYTRKDAVNSFCTGESEPWKYWRGCGYDVKRIAINL